jgi:integrase
MIWDLYGVASVHRDPRFPKGVWYCQYQLADGRRAFRSTGRYRKAEAQIICQAWQQAENEAANGELTKDRLGAIFSETLTRLGESPIERISVKEWLEDWLVSKDQVSERTKNAYQQIVREFLAFLGPQGANRRLEAITEQDIEAFVRLLRTDGRSASTINKLVRKYLSVPFEKARKLGKIRYNPVMATEALKAESLSKGTFSAKQVVALLRVADPDWQGAILFAYGTGARLGDAANLKWSSLDVANGVVTFQERKTGRAAVLGLHPDFLDWVAERAVPDEPESYVFPSLAGRPLNSSRGLSNTFVRLLDAAGIEKRLLRQANDGKGRAVRALTFHSFRHTAASNVFNQAALKEITRRVSNHAAGGVVDRYIHEDLEAIRAATQLIPRLPK